MKKILLMLFIGLLVISPAIAEGFNFDLDLGFEYLDVDGEPLYGLNLQPDISIGNFGIGLKGSVYFQLDVGGDPMINLVLDNWIPEFVEGDDLLGNIQTAASLYLPIITYVRYGYKGDPLHLKLGQIENVTLGTGMFFNQYSNTSLSDTTLIGAVLDVDGRLFNFPYIGFEALTGNLSQFDTIGGRLYVRPLAFVDFPVIKDIQIAGSFAVDSMPGLYDDTFAPNMVSMYGADIIIPILTMPQAALKIFGDIGVQPSPIIEEDVAIGYRVGFNGQLFNLLKLKADLTFPSNGFRPGYFNASYDRDKKAIYQSTGIYESSSLILDNNLLHGGVGFNLFNDGIVFDLDLYSEVTLIDSVVGIVDPSLTARISTGENLIGLFFFDAVYKKNVLDDESVEAFLTDIINLKNSEIRANVSIKYSIFLIESGYVIAFDELGVMQEPEVTIGGTINLF
ncbi:MAG: hypothetical protein HQ557_13885 [Bacteroidetes bacterium]|nr:hypothetical protein [Bacteroidota bacterium]